MADETEIPQGQTAYRRLLDDIRNGALLPGARLRETELAERLGISRTPVREAIRQLEADGLVTHLPRQGATIRSLDHGEVIELYEMRAVLE
jgi:DNA-binding GntR family transcriptional regulator